MLKPFSLIATHNTYFFEYAHIAPIIIKYHVIKSKLIQQSHK